MAKPIRDAAGHRRYERQLVRGGGDLGFRLTEPADAECYFCDGRAVKWSHEHIIPQWLQDDLGMRHEVFSPTYHFMDQRHERGDVPATNLVAAEGICKDCNSGWMSQVESDFQPYVRGRRRDVPIEPIVRWFVKTAFVLNVSQNTRLLVPRPVRVGLGQGTLSSRVGVYFHRVRKVEKGGGRLNWAQAGGAVQSGFLAEAHIPRLRDSIKRLWSCAIRIDDIVGTVVVNPPGDLYRSSWEVLGQPALEAGEFAEHLRWSHLNKVRVFSNAAFLVPWRWSWGDAAAFRKEGLPFPEGAAGASELQAFQMAATTRLMKDGLSLTLERTTGDEPSDVD